MSQQFKKILAIAITTSSAIAPLLIIQPSWGSSLPPINKAALKVPLVEEESRSPLAHGSHFKSGNPPNVLPPLGKGGTRMKVPLVKGRHCGDATIGANPLGLGVSPSKASGVDLGGSLAQNSQLTRVTGIEIRQTPAGTQVILKTPIGQPKLVPLILPEGNNLVIDILDATLAFSIRNGVTQTNPAPGIREVRVNKIDATSIRVTIAGEQQAPSAEVIPSKQDLVLSVTPEATAPTEADEEIEIVVTGERESDNYAVPNSSAGTRTNAAIRDIPQSIQVVPQQVIEDQGATELSEVLRNVSGVSANGDNIRGFGANETGISGVFVDGNRQGRESAFDLSNVEQVEVLKGPASVLYGQGEPGGIVNVVTKQPQKEPAYEVEARIGNFDFYRGTLDLTGPLNEGKTFLYRLNLAYENAGSPVDFVEDENFAIFPTLSFELSKKTKLTLEGGYQNTTEINDPDLPEELGDVPTSLFLGEPEFDVTNTAYFIGYRLDHQFSNNWSLRNQFKADFSDYDEFFVGLDSLEEDNRTVSRFASRFKTFDETYTLRTEVNGKIATGIVKQDLLLGIEYTRRVADGYFIERELASIDLFDPEYDRFSLADFEPTDEEIVEPGSSDSIGIYAQDLVAIGDRVKIVLGGRFDWLKNSGFNFSETEEELTDFSPRVGIVYQPIEPVSLYANYAGSFSPQFGIDREGNSFVPITGEQLEVGVKGEFFNGGASATLAAYQITRANDFVPDPVDDNFDIQVGESRSRGLELDLRGELLPGWNLIATYAYNDAVVTEDPTGLEGSKLTVPEHSGSLWTVYEFQQGSLKGLGLGGGVFVTGEVPVDVGTTETDPSAARTAALLYYRRDNWKAQLNIDNVFDAEYSDNSKREEPFIIRGQLSAEF
jgi:iron complex outermembrane recepter protein